MDFKLSTELKMLQKAVREFAVKKIKPNADQWDQDHYLPYKEVIKPMGELGFFWHCNSRRIWWRRHGMACCNDCYRRDCKSFIFIKSSS